MKGHGWQCDTCGWTVLKEDDVMGRNRGRPPQGWYVVFRDMAEPEGVEPCGEWHFCSKRCVHRWAEER